MSRWTTAGASVRCQRCDRLIVAGEVYRLVSTGEWPYCAACVEQFHGLTPPADLETRETPRFQLPEGITRFNKAQVGAELRGRILDYRRKASGE